MAFTNDEKVLHLPARKIPTPTSVSPEAQAVLAMGRLGPPPADYPALDDVVGWQAYVAQTDEFVRSMMGDSVSTFAGTVATRDIGDCPVHVATPHGVGGDDRRVYLDIHGGAWVLGGGELCRRSAATAATHVAARTWSVDYRMPPEHPFPTPLDDCVAAYRALLAERDPTEIVVGGSSAGGNLAAALVLRARAEGLPLPAGLVVNTGAFDLTGAGDSRQTNEGLDNILSAGAEPCVLLYAGGHDRRDPFLSPLFGDLTGLPPTILLTGTRDLLLSDNVRMHRALRAAGVDAELHVWEAASHGGFLGMAPEDEDRFGELRRFAHRCWRTGRTASGGVAP
jgi:monoterpene epsilon-lactone hydrolase